MSQLSYESGTDHSDSELGYHWATSNLFDESAPFDSRRFSGNGRPFTVITSITILPLFYQSFRRIMSSQDMLLGPWAIREAMMGGYSRVPILEVSPGSDGVLGVVVSGSWSERWVAIELPGRIITGDLLHPLLDLSLKPHAQDSPAARASLDASHPRTPRERVRRMAASALGARHGRRCTGLAGGPAGLGWRDSYRAPTRP